MTNGNARNAGRVSHGAGQGREPRRGSSTASTLAEGAAGRGASTLGTLIFAALLLVVWGGAARAATRYDAAWEISSSSSGGASVEVLDDLTRGTVVALNGTLADVFRLGGGSLRWGNRDERLLSWDMRTEERFAVYVILATERGGRYLRYTGAESSRLHYKPSGIDHGLGTGAMNGSWRSHERDLDADLAAGEPGNRIISVDGVRFRGNALLDDVTLRSGGALAAAPLPAPAPTAAPIPVSDPAPARRQVIDPSGRLLAFPDAEGHGRFAQGGRGGRVVIVDTLEDIVDGGDGRTSLREALEVLSGPRTVVFDVGGTFDTGSRELVMSGEGDSNVTVACQSAPSPGVLIRGYGIRIRGGARDIVMRHCAVRNLAPNSSLAGSSRALAVIGSSKPSGDMIFDHMSLGWATDENFTAFIGPGAGASLENITLSRSIVAEGDADSAHPESGQLPNRYLHAMGPSCGSASKRFRILGCSIIGNLIAHNARRNPLMWGASGEVINNAVYNWHETGLDARPWEPGRIDLYVNGNVFKSGPTTRTDKPTMRLIDEGRPATNLRVSDNRFVNGVTGASRALESVSVGSPDRETSRVAALKLDCVGASRPARSAFDSRVLAEYRDGTGRVGIGSNHRRDYRGHEAARHPDAHDTDRDGMADAWELRADLDPNDPNDHRGDADGDGYTNIEEYLYELGAC